MVNRIPLLGATVRRDLVDLLAAVLALLLVVGILFGRPTSPDPAPAVGVTANRRLLTASESYPRMVKLWLTYLQAADRLASAPSGTFPAAFPRAPSVGSTASSLDRTAPNWRNTRNVRRRPAASLSLVGRGSGALSAECDGLVARLKDSDEDEERLAKELGGTPPRSDRAGRS